MSLSWPTSWFNRSLAESPMNWLIVGLMATVALMGLHVLATAFGTMQSTMPQGAYSAPGAVPGPLQSTGSALAVPLDPNASQIWTDDNEATFYGDGTLLSNN